MRARLMGIEYLTIQPIDRAGILTDEDEDEPVARIPRLATVVDLPAQVDEIADNDRRPSQGGAQLRAVYRVTVRRTDLEGVPYTPRNGDLVTVIKDRKKRNPRTVNLYIRLAVHAGNMVASQRTLQFLDLLAEHPQRWGSPAGG